MVINLDAYQVSTNVTVAVYISSVTCIKTYMQSPCYKYLTAVLCKVTIIDFYSQPIQENHGYSTVANQDGKMH